jgi:hypothetical protein
LSRGWAEQKLLFLYLCISEEEDTPTRKQVTWSESIEQRLGTAEADISVLVYIGEEEDTPTRKRVTWSESLEQRLGTAEANISVLVYR